MDNGQELATIISSEYSDEDSMISPEGETTLKPPSNKPRQPKFSKMFKSFKNTKTLHFKKKYLKSFDTKKFLMPNSGLATVKSLRSPHPQRKDTISLEKSGFAKFGERKSPVEAATK